MKTPGVIVGALTTASAAVLLVFFLVLTERLLPVSAQDDANIIRSFQQKRWSFDIQNGVIRFSHGNHRRRDRWFKAYFGTGYDECGNCHNLGLPYVAEEGMLLEDGEHLNTVEDIRDYEDDIYPFGIMMARCFEACHNGLTAPNDCMNCHLPGSRALTEGTAALSDEMRTIVVQSREGTPGVYVFSKNGTLWLPG